MPCNVTAWDMHCETSWQGTSAVERHQEEHMPQNGHWEVHMLWNITMWCTHHATLVRHKRLWNMTGHHSLHTMAGRPVECTWW